MGNEFFNPEIVITTCNGERLRRWKYANLATPYWRLYWNRTPGAVISLRGYDTPLDRDHIVLIPPDTPFSTRNTSPVDHLYIHFTAQAPFLGVKPAVFKIPIDEATQRWVEELYTLSPADSTPAPRAVLLALTLVHLALAHVPAPLLITTNYDVRIIKAIRAVEESPHLPQSNTALARYLHMNTNAFIRLFKKQTGVSPQAYSLSKRIEKACLLLHTTRQGIKEIAEQTGFCDRYHFTRAFTRLRGIPPARFRVTRRIASR